MLEMWPHPEELGAQSGFGLVDRKLTFQSHWPTTYSLPSRHHHFHLQPISWCHPEGLSLRCLCGSFPSLHLYSNASVAWAFPGHTLKTLQYTSLFLLPFSSCCYSPATTVSIQYICNIQYVYTYIIQTSLGIHRALRPAPFHRYQNCKFSSPLYKMA